MKLPKLKMKKSVDAKIKDFAEKGAPKAPIATEFESASSWNREKEAFDKEMEAYKAEADALAKFAEIKQSKKKIGWLPSPDTIVTVAGSVASVWMILNFEKAEVMVSKAVSFIPKLK